MKYKKIVLFAMVCLACAAAPAAASDSNRAEDMQVEFLTAVLAGQDDGAERSGETAQEDKVSGAAKYLNSSSEEEQTEELLSGNGNVLTQEQREALPIASLPRLGETDFHIGGLGRGDQPGKMTKLFGNPSKQVKSAHYTTAQYDRKKDLVLQVKIRNESGVLTAAGSQARPGVEAAFLAEGRDVVFGRGLKLKMPAEILMRNMGIPSSVLRDADGNIYYFSYENPERDTMLVLAVADRKIERAALMPVRLPYGRVGGLPAQNSWSERDFSLMGFSLNTPFEANKYNMWNNLVKRDGNDFWLYGDYGVEVDRRNTIKKVFLLTNNAYTSRGATLGYHISTVLSLYGRPDKVEIGPDAEKAVDAYYYDSPYEKGVSLVFVVNHKSRYVDDVLLVSAPIRNLQDPMARYGLK